ncbi:hypothetical protein B5C26_20230 [Photorhabdus luminescens]|uniref:hypothetical protein n=1 Tax=Photorhabdus luminescens TaxID=29488 RepID=UPI000B4DD7A5|nr:hypothetical protein [Photorhabdus luminescens]OWO79833.1 hypothetical protein B5C26_20230 [Photorhabdus luminescens]
MNLIIADALEYKGRIKKFASGNKNVIIFLFLLLLPAKFSGIFEVLMTLSSNIVISESYIKSFYFTAISLIVYMVFYVVNIRFFPSAKENSIIVSLVGKKTLFFSRIVFFIYSAFPMVIFFFIGFFYENVNYLHYLSSVFFLIVSFAVIGFCLFELNFLHFFIVAVFFLLAASFRNGILYDLIFTLVIPLAALILYLNFTPCYIINRNKKLFSSGFFSLPYIMNLRYCFNKNKMSVLIMALSVLLLYLLCESAFSQIPNKADYISLIYASVVLYICMLLFYNLSYIEINYLSYLSSFLSVRKILFFNYCICLFLYLLCFFIFCFLVVKSFPVIIFLSYVFLSIIVSFISLLRTQYTKIIIISVIFFFTLFLGVIYA